MNFIVYDLILLVIFGIFMSVFLYTRRKKIKKEGLLLLYKSNWGIKLIEKVSKKYKKTLKVLSYVSIFTGYVLMILMIYFFARIIFIYLFRPEIIRAIKIPPIMPLIPYLPQAFKLDFLPPFYFIYWIIIIAIIAIPHELAHGFYAAYNKIKIKNTGFGFFPFFLPVFLAAFVEPDEKQMKKTSKFSQMSILSAGTFANILTAFLFFILLVLFFITCFSPAGIVFDNYAYSVVSISAPITLNGNLIENTSYDNLLDSMNDDLNEIEINENKYLITKMAINNSETREYYEEYSKLVLFDEAPAIKSQLVGVISEIDNELITSKEKLSEVLDNKEIRQEVVIKTIFENKETEYNLILEEHPEVPGKAWIGIGFINAEPQGILGRVTSTFSFFKKPDVYYKANFSSATFFYNLLWWIVLISFSVALINMLPVGIFDGGRFFFLTIAGITGSEKIAKKVFTGITFLFLALLGLIMFFWLFSFF